MTKRPRRNPTTDLTDPDETRALVRTFVLPGVLALRLEATGAPTSLLNQPLTKGAVP